MIDMTPQEKAKELVDEFDELLTYRESKTKTKQCALIAVDEILNNFGNLTDGKPHYCNYSTVKFYKEVRQEIENL